MTCFDEEPDHQPTKEEWEAMELLKEDDATAARRFANELNQARDAITVLQTSVIANTSRINRAIEVLIEMDEAEDPRLASQLNHVMSILEGKA